MDLSTQKKFRTVFPGLLMFFALAPICLQFIGMPPKSIAEEINLSSLTIDSIIVILLLALSYVLGSLYNTYLFRALYNANSYERINKNIKERLLKIGRTKPLSSQRRAELLSGKELMSIFYELIDNNETLQKRGELVRHNGTIWTSLADVVVIGFLTSCLYLPFIIFDQHKIFVIWALGSASLALIVHFLLFPQSERRQIELGNDQLDFIEHQ